ncbi:MAG: Stk1 family PASTA domain-containing Ser/Thr kinase [Bacilli bacterium]
MVNKGQKINDRYLIIRSIGEGGMANVYLAHDVILDRDVAIKVLRGDLANDEKFVRRFQREALSASSLSHPNIVEMYDVGEDNGTYYIVMEYVDGKTLKQLVKKRGALTLSESIDIMLQLTEGIEQAHEAGIVHRDIKPQNILIKDDGCIKITDFGVAMALNSTQLTQTNSVMGSVHYLPPEQASGKGCTLRSDIYSMGIVFYELLTGGLPFKGDNAVEIALKHMRDTIPSVRTKNPSIPQSVENVILKSTAKNPKNRYHDTKEMREDLLTVLNDDRLDEAKYIYPYPEHEIEDKVVVKKEKKPIISEETEDLVKQIKEDDTVRRTNTWIWILSGILGVIIVVIASIFLLIPSLTKIPDVKIPDVTGKSVIDAESILKEAGFGVEVQTNKIESDVDKGKVVSTEPSIGRSVKKGTLITITESLGKKVYVIEDYLGANYIEIKTLLENMHKLKVTIEKKDGDPAKEYTNQEIIEQSIKPGTKVSEGDTIILYIPKIVDGYPNMVEEGWVLEDIKNFCTKYNITLTVDYEETAQYTKGMLISQSRAPKTPIVSGSTLKVVIAKEPSTVTNPGEPPVDPTSPLKP